MLAIEYLEDAGFRVDAAASATEAMNKLGLVPGGIDAAIVDLGLPDRRGDMLVAEMRAIHPTLPIVLATGQSSAHVGAIFKGDPKVSFVAKPYSAHSLLDALRRVGIEGESAKP
jgi:DNA-binding NtrC family response regulator